MDKATEQFLAVLMEDVGNWEEIADFLDSVKGSIQVLGQREQSFFERAEYYRGLAKERRKLIEQIRTDKTR